jgi:PAS domain S-box-containing protein
VPASAALAAILLPEDLPLDALGLSLFNASVDCVEVVGLDGTLLAMNVNGGLLMEIEDFEALRNRPWADLWPVSQRPAVETAIALARTGEVARFTAERPTGNGVTKWCEVIVSPMFDEGGHTARMISISRDVTDQRRAQEDNDLLLRELAHRIKNMFAVVDGLISLSARETKEVKPFADALRLRLRGLGRAVAYVAAPELMGRDDDETFTLHGLLHVLLGPYGDMEGLDRRVAILGDDMNVGRSAVTSIALFANELATNALKYGALSRPEGRIQVTTVFHDDGLELLWEEHLPNAPPPPNDASNGFGTTLLDIAVTRQLNGRLVREWGPLGLVVRIHLPPERLGR